MTAELPNSRTASEDSTRVSLVDETARRQFEAAWTRGQPQRIEDLLPAEDSEHYLPTLEELVHIDLEFAWKARSGNETSLGSAAPPLVENYVQRFGQLNQTSILQRLLEQEYRVRQRHGDRPPPDDYAKRFPDVFVTLQGPETESPTTTVHVPRDLPDLPGYDVLGELGHGGMGVVYQARHRALNRVVAVKMLRDRPSDRPEVAARFQAEAEAVARLRHPNIVQVYEVGEHGGRPFFTLEFVPGGSLDRLLTGAPQPPQPAARLVAQLARAVHYAHQQGVVHRDLKPGNILLSAELKVLSAESEAPLSTQHSALSTWSPKVTDFGLAKLLETPSQTKTGDLLGTPCYMAPEQARGDQGRVGPTADVYSLGAVLYECLTGRPPFRGVNSWDTVQQVIADEPVQPRQLQPTVPADLETICLKCLTKEPARRYATADALADDLERFLRDEPVRARPAGRAERLWRWCRRNPVVAGLSAAFGLVVVVSLVGLTALWLRAESSADDARRQRDRANANFRKARDAVDQMLARVGFDRLYSVPKMDKVRRELLDEALRYYQGFLVEQGDDPAVRAETGRVYRQAGAVSFQLGRHQQADEYFRAGAALLEPLVEQSPDDLRLRLELRYCHGVLGDLQRLVGQFAEAEQSFRRQVRLHRKSGPEAQLPEHVGNLADGIMNLGFVFGETGRPDAAAEAYQEAISLLTPSAATDVLNRHDLGIAKRSLGLLFAELGQADEAERLVRESLSLHEQLAAGSPDYPLYRQGVGLDLSRLGNLLRDAGEYEQAEDAYRRALERQRKLVADFPGYLEYRADLAETQIQLCALLTQSGRRLDAELVQAHHDAVALYQALADEFRAITFYRSRLASAKESLGVILRETGRTADAERLFRESADQYERLAAEFPDAPKYRAWYAAALYRLGSLLRDADRSADAEAVLGKAVAIREKLVADFPDVPAYRRQLADAQTNLRNVLTDNGRPVTPELVQAEQDAVAYFQKLVDESPASPGHRERLAVSLSNLASTFQTLGKVREAEDARRRAQALYEALVAEAPAVRNYRYVLGRNLDKLSTLMWFSNRLNEGLEFERQALALFERLADEEPSVPEYRYWVSSSCYMLAVYHRNLRRTAEAETLHAQALAVRQKLVADYPDSTKYRLAVATSHTSRGIVLVSLGRHNEAEEGYRWAIEVYEKLLADMPGVPSYLSLLGGTLDNYAESLLARGKPAEAKTKVEQAIVHEQAALKANPRHPQYLQFMGSHYGVLAEAHLRLGEHAGATQAARNLSQLLPQSGPKSREAASLVARCIPLAEKDAQLSETERLAAAQTYTGQALRLLQEAVQKGYNDAANLRNDPHLAPLRSHPDYQRLLAELEKRSPG